MQHKILLLQYMEWTGFVDPLTPLVVLGIAEIGFGLFVLIRPLRPILLIVMVWKLTTELIYPLSGDYVFEFVERAGSFGAPLALFWVRCALARQYERDI